jgi:hypothetical protein
MSDPKFIIIDMGLLGKKTISLDNILSIERFGLVGSAITLKEIKDGNNVVIHSVTSPEALNRIIASI